MTAGFLVFGAGVIAFGAALRVVCPGRAWTAAVATAACTIGVAATPLGGWSGDAAHATFAGAGYVTLVALPVLAAGPLRAVGPRGRVTMLGRRRHRVRARASRRARSARLTGSGSGSG